jgi:hypothetical protein
MSDPCIPGLFDQGDTPAPAESARATGHRLAALSAQRAETASPGWVEAACILVALFAATTPAPFLMEDARRCAELQGLGAPPDKRAWGAVTQALKRKGVIQACGTGAARSSHGSPKVLWRRP